MAWRLIFRWIRSLSVIKNVDLRTLEKRCERGGEIDKEGGGIHLASAATQIRYVDGMAVGVRKRSSAQKMQIEKKGEKRPIMVIWPKSRWCWVCVLGWKCPRISLQLPDCVFYSTLKCEKQKGKKEEKRSRETFKMRSISPGKAVEFASPGFSEGNKHTHTHLIQTSSKQITYECCTSNGVCGVTLEAFLLEEKLSSLRMQTCWKGAHLETWALETFALMQQEIRSSASPSFSTRIARITFVFDTLWGPKDVTSVDRNPSPWTEAWMNAQQQFRFGTSTKFYARSLYTHWPASSFLFLVVWSDLISGRPRGQRERTK